MKKKCGGLFKEFVKAIVKHTIVFILCRWMILQFYIRKNPI